MIASVILLEFTLFGDNFLAYMGITLAVLKISGGILPLLCGINMVLTHSSGITTTTAGYATEDATKQNISFSISNATDYVSKCDRRHSIVYG